MIWLWTRLHTRMRYPTVWAVVGEAFGVILSLMIYWYTSKAFEPALASHLEPSVSYFDYLLLGELSLLLPIRVLESIPGGLKQSLANGTIEYFQTLPRSLAGLIAWVSLTPLLTDFLRLLITVSLAKLFFSFGTSIAAMITVVVMIAASLPLFLGFSFIAAAVWFRLGWGQSALFYISAVGSFLAGAYFPSNVLPAPWVTLSKTLSPFSWTLDAVRSLSQTPSMADLFRFSLPILVLGLLILGAGVVLFEQSQSFTRRTGRSWLIQ